MLHRLVDAGNTVVVIEHNLDVIKTADHIVDLGPEGGAGGGKVVAKGTPEDIAATAGSYTGHYLKPLLETGRTPARAAGGRKKTSRKAAAPRKRSVATARRAAS